MSISYPALLKKLEQELYSAKESQGSPQMREHIYSMKTLCEVILEEGQEVQYNKKPMSQPMPNQMQAQQQPSRSVQVDQSEPIKTDDGANGDSIFDF
ncbi:YwdI family protein [Falsibacillus albus]|uniref:YwdI family protein n=1 Tax=Falsibacillus albus TaxID=2478915 RepID=A0A3L7JYD1_9BACI|nr:YwdI family protein [Falsibacillus albus]RLQ93452.1 hypothetical protein D9X91_17265 [Falsibacillus albus]